MEKNMKKNVYLNYFAIQLELTHHYKFTILQ